MSRNEIIGRSLLVLALVVLCAGALAVWSRTVDDAFITLRYSRNLAEGAGPVFNPGERVEGYSTPLWMVLMAGAARAGLDPVPIAKLLGLACSLGLVTLLYTGLSRRGVGPVAAGGSALLLGSSLVLQIWSVAGMETTAYAALFFAGVLALARQRLGAREAVEASSLLVLAALTRPEGLAFWGLGAAVVAFTAARTGAGRVGTVRTILGYLWPGSVLVLHEVWRWSYYGSPLPNTYYVKTGGGWEMWEQGARGLRGFLSQPAHLAWIGAATLAVILARKAPSIRRSAALLGGAVAIHLLYVVGVGDDGLRVHRFYVPVMAPAAFLVGTLFPIAARIPRHAVLLRSMAILSIAISCGGSMWKMHRELAPALRSSALAYQQGNEKLGRYLARTRTAETVIAVAAAGAIPYYSGLPTIDMYGLNDGHISGRPFPEQRGARMMKWDNDYVLTRRPGLIAINRGYFGPGDLLADRVRIDPGLLAVAPMDRDLFARVARDGGYGLRRIDFEDGSCFFVFERR